MERLISPQEQQVLYQMMGVSNRLRFVEFECKLLQSVVIKHKSLVGQIVKAVKHVMPISSVKNYVTISSQNDQRITIEGVENIQRLCTNGGQITDEMNASVMEKRSVQKHLETEMGVAKAKELFSLGSDTVSLKEAEIKATLRAEIPFSRTVTTIPNDSFVRVIQRYSFKGPTWPDWQFDISAVRSGHYHSANSSGDNNSVSSSSGGNNQSLAQIIKSQPTYEIELEYLAGGKNQPSEAIKTACKQLLVLMAPPFIEYQHSKYLLKQSEIEAYRKEFLSYGVPIVHPVTMSIVHLAKDNPNNIYRGYTVTSKTDGERCLLLASKDRNILRIDRNLRVANTGQKVQDDGVVPAVLDGEELNNNQYFAFDTLLWAGESTSDLPFISLESGGGSQTRFPCRLEYCQHWVTNVAIVNQYPDADFEYHTKKFVFAEGVDDMSTACQTLLDEGESPNTMDQDGDVDLTTVVPTPVDGLVFTPAFLGIPKSSGSWSRLLKWKPEALNTIDFLVKFTQEPLKIVDGNPSRLVHLMVGKSSDTYIYPMLQMTDEYHPPYKPYYGRSRIAVPFQPDSPADPDAYLCYLKVDENGNSYVEKERIEDDTIVEFTYSLLEHKWHPVRIRHDKTDAHKAGSKVFGQDYKVANNIYHTIHNPIDPDMLKDASRLHAISNNYSYYDAPSGVGGDTLQRMYKFHNGIKRELIAKNVPQRATSSPTTTLLELGCGKLGDLKKYIAANIPFVVGVDSIQDNFENLVDGAAVRVLQNRIISANVPNVLLVHADCRKSLLDSSQSALDPRAAEYLNLLNSNDPKGKSPTLAKTKYLENFKGMAHKRYDMISMQFAIHYMMENEHTLDAFIDNLSKLSKPGTVFIGTCLDGKTVFDALRMVPTLRFMNEPSPQAQKPVPGDSLVAANSQIQFGAELRRMWDPSVRQWTGTVSDIGMQLEVWYETFSSSHTEYLVPFHVLEEKMTKAGFQLSSSEMFDKLMLNAQEPLTTTERQLSFMHRAFVFVRQEEKPLTAEPSVPPPSLQAQTQTKKTIVRLPVATKDGKVIKPVSILPTDTEMKKDESESKTAEQVKKVVVVKRKIGNGSSGGM